MTDIARLETIIEPEAKALGFDLVRVKMMQSEAGSDEKSGGQALQIMAEDPATGQLIIDQCAALSRAISERFDVLEESGQVVVEGAYHLEVSSPGIDRPLTREKDYVNWAGHEVRIVMIKGFDGPRVYKGMLEGLSSGTVTVADKKLGTVQLPLSEIHTAKLVLTDALIAATRPLDSSGADEIVEEEKAET